MVILGIDPGTNRIGYGVLNKKTDNSISMINYGCLELKTSDNKNYSNLNILYEAIKKLISEHKPEIVAVEKLYFFKNINTALPVSEARGVIILAAAKSGLDIREFTPLQVKQAVSGHGRAQKKEIQKMIRLILGLKTDPEPDDAADALAVAICCANTRVFLSNV